MTGLSSRISSSARILPALALACVTGFAFFLRVYYSYDKVFLGDWVRFKGYDSWYHVRLIESFVHNFPRLITYDPYTYYPHGQAVFFAPFYDVIVGTTSWVLGAGSPSQGMTENLAAYFPAILGALVAIPVFFLGKTLFNKTVGLIAAALVVVLPGQILLRSTLGFSDHHAAEVLFSSAALLFFALAVKNAKEREIGFSSVRAKDWAKLRRPLIYSILAGVALAAYLLSWVGGALVVFIIFVFAFAQYTSDHLRGRSTDYLCIIGVPCFAVALLLLMPFLARLDYGQMQSLTLIVAIVALLWLSALSAAMRHLHIHPAFYPLAVLVVTGAGLGAFYLIAPEKLSIILGELRWLNPRAEQLTIGEMRPLTLTMAWEEFTTSFYLSLVSLVVIAYLAIREGAAEKMLLLVWSAVMLVAMLSENRFAYYFAVNVSVLTAFLVWKTASLVSARVLPRRAAATASAPERLKTGKRKAKGGKKSKHKEAKREWAGPGTAIAGYPLSRIVYGVIVAVAVFFLVFFPNIGMAIDTAGANTTQVASWREPLLWMKDNTPDPFGDPDFYNQVFDEPPRGEDYNYPDTAYGVMAWWDYGHWITEIAHRIPNSNPHQRGANEAAWYFTSQDEASGNEMLNKLGSRYVALDLWMALHEIDAANGVYGNFHGVVSWAGKQEDEFFGVYYQKTESGALQPTILYYPEYYRCMSTRLYVFDGKEVIPNNSTYVISYEEKVARGGEHYKEITSVRRFATYQEGASYLEQQTGQNYRLVGYSELRSPVPLEKLEHYTLVHESTPPEAQPGEVALPEVKIFEYTP
jgi:oligosaccharyl transferase (archaeosortase A-associated)